MKLFRVTASGRTEIRGHGLRPDDSVAAAAEILERTLKGGKVHMWCERPIDAHEAYAIIRSGGGDARTEAESRLGVTLTAAEARTPLKVLAALKKREEKGGLREEMSIRNRYLLPGGYYAKHVSNPFAGDNGKSGATARANGQYSSPVNLGTLLLESFGADEINVTTRTDVAATGAPKEVLDLYFPDLPDKYDYMWDGEARARVEEHDKASVKSMISFVSLAGGSAEGRQSVPFESLMRVFATRRTTSETPVIRIQGGGIERPVARAHDSASTEAIAELKDPASREWLQAIFLVGKGSAELVVYPGGSYKARIRFGRLERASADDVAGYFTGINSFLEDVSPFIRPLSRRALDARASSLMPKAYMLNTPHVMGGPRGGVYQWSTVPLARTCTLQSVKKAAEELGHPSLKVVNLKDGEIHMQWMRCNELTARAVVKNVLHHTTRVNEQVLNSLSSETGLSKADLLDISSRPFDRSTVMAAVTVRIQSDATLAVGVRNGNDVRYGARAAAAVMAVAKGCAGKRSSSSASWNVTSSEPLETEPGERMGDLDDFYAFLEEDAEAEEEEEKAARPSSSSSSSDPIDPTKTDVLSRLQLADPDVFAFPTESGYTPYSVRCQKTSKRQPLVLTDEELAAARAESSSTGNDSLDTSLRYRGNNYVCPVKWCPVSGVARGLTEPCPGDEPEWKLWDSHFPGLQAGVFHPDGLCMPCCFGKKIKPGSKKHADLLKCTGEGEEGEKKEATWKTDYTGKSDKLLDDGSFGFAPAELFAGTARGVVRRGMGNRSRATLLRAYAAATGTTPKKAVAEMAKGLRLIHTIQCDARAFMPEGECGDFPSAAAAASWLKTNRDYVELMGIGKVGADQRRREWLLKRAHEELKARLEAGGDGLNDATFYRLINSGAGDLIPVVLVTLDEANNSFAEHAPSRVFSEPWRAAVVVKRGIHEPLGTRSKKGFDGRWAADHPWISKIKEAVQTSVPVSSKRMVGYSLMAVAAIVEGKSGYAAFRKPVFIDPAMSHAYIADGALKNLTPASDKWASAYLKQTGNEFYRNDWRKITQKVQENDDIDALLFGCDAGVDERTEEMRAITAKMDSLRKISAAIGEEMEPGDFEMKKGESSKAAVRRLKAKYGKHAKGHAASAVEHAIEHMLRPIPSGLLPTFRSHADERIVTRS
nr:hypothetical protein TetV2_00518 [Oceanusvirus sp.]